MRSVVQRIDQFVRPGEYQRRQAEEAAAKAREQEELKAQLDAFLSTAWGQQLAERLERDKQKALADLVKTKPGDWERITELQNKYRVADYVLTYIASVLLEYKNK